MSEPQKSLTELLDDIERRAADRTECSFENCPECQITKRDVPALVKALRMALEFAMGWRDHAADRAIEEQIAQLLREPAEEKK